MRQESPQVGEANQGKKGRRKTLSQTSASCQALPVVQARSYQSHCRLTGKQQPYPVRSFLSGELNVDVLDHDACQKLAKWFEDRWSDHWCFDISDELAQIIDESWAP